MIGQALKSKKIKNVPVLASRQRAVQAREMSQVDLDYDIILRGRSGPHGQGPLKGNHLNRLRNA